ncbi:Bcr/CflA family drug resistance efflux transporter [Emticicia aquatilis]|uniref:Bcr/CflA family drug resistance efflux transporter n=1 Tax=Emticicia aquatilis TaxID=1537369 RepID=A0A917DUS7_9BACT|nr:multidrug effflux MFS transporter [Emticicia aquatilis]GGD69161.1 Bcr/CflA family drug resistance efflux transporter [Emticicia aquatilis]
MNNNRFLLILILGLLSAIGPFSIDTYLSGFPSIAADLKVTVDDVSYSLSSFFIGISVGQLIYGPLLDRFGRKIPLIVGLVIYFVASVGCALATSIEMLIALRFLQALGGCVGMVAPRAIVRDSFPVQESAKIFSTLILILGVSPIIAPTVGSYMITAMGWHSVFWLQGGMGLLLFLAVVFFLAESKNPDESISLKPQHIIPSFFNIFRNPQFFTYAFAGSMVSGGVYAYLSGSPFVFMKMYHVTEQQYGWIFGFLAGGLILSSQLNNFALKTFRSEQIVRVVLTTQTIIGCVLCIGSAFDWLNLYSMIMLIFLFLCCQGFSFPNASALSLVPFSKEAGRASALLGAIQMGIGSLSAALVGALSDGTSLPMTAVMAACAVLGLTIFRVGRMILEKNDKVALG